MLRQLFCAFNLIRSGRAQPGVVFVLDSLVDRSETSLISPSNPSVVPELTLYMLIANGRVGGGDEGGLTSPWEEMQTLLPWLGSGLCAPLWNFLQCFIFIVFI